MDNKIENREVAIRLSGVKKMYKLGQIGGGTLQGDLQSWWARMRGKEDPNTKIGTDQRLVGQTFMALNGIDLTVYKGEALGIIGGNGAGKSTMLKLLSRVTAPTAGEIDIYGRITSMLEVGTGFNGEMTGRENVYMNGAILGMTKAEIDAKMEDIIEFSEVREFIDTPVKRYSSGMYVKLAFSVAAHLDSEIMIMDEVLAVGDMAFQKKCLDKMRDAAKQEGRTVLYVSHNMNTIRQLCDRCIVLDKGKIVFIGDVENAIAIYTGVSLDASLDFVFERGNLSSADNKAILLKAVHIVNTLQNSFREDDGLDLVLDLDVRRPINDIQFRFEVRYIDGTVAGTALTDAKIDFAEIGLTQISLRFAPRFLVPGYYTAGLVVYIMDSLGNDIWIDGVQPAISFQIEEIPKTVNPLWVHKYWGHVRLNDVKILGTTSNITEEG